MNEEQRNKFWVNVGKHTYEVKNQQELDSLFVYLWDTFPLGDVDGPEALIYDEKPNKDVTHYFYSKDEYDAFDDRLSFLSATGVKFKTFQSLNPSDYFIKIMKEDK